MAKTLAEQYGIPPGVRRARMPTMKWGEDMVEELRSLARQTASANGRADCTTISGVTEYMARLGMACAKAGYQLSPTGELVRKP